MRKGSTASWVGDHCQTARVFTPEVRAAVAAAKADDQFTLDQGVMIGNGEVWMNEIRGSMKIITVNHTQ